MWLPSRLQGTTLGDVLGGLYRERVTGALELLEHGGVADGRVHRVHLSHGLVSHVETASRTRRLGEILRAEGLLDARAASDLERAALMANARRFGEVLLDARVVTPRALARALERQQRDRLECLYRLADARLRFRVARRAPAPSGAVPLGPDEFLHGRPRARDVAPAPSVSRQDPVRVEALQTLGLDATATPQDVQRAFRKLARSTHPDRFAAASPAARARMAHRFSTLSSAYHALIA